MRRTLAHGLVAMAIISSSCPAASAQDETTREREALSARAANRTVQRDLLSVFEPVAQIDSGMVRQLRGVGLRTRAFGTEFPGVCRRDALTLRYAATDQDAKPEDRPVRPYGVETQAFFHVDHLPRLSGTGRGDGAEVWQEQCVLAGRDEGENWFAATDARTAVRGVLVLAAAVAAVRSGALKPSPCPSVFYPEKQTCEAAILENGDVAKIDSIDMCPATAGTMCFNVDLNSSTKLTITARAAGDALVPSAITSIAIAQYIVVT